MPTSFEIRITGQVQGVGFRPFVYTLAKNHNLKGCVFNNQSGVVLTISTNKNEASAFLEAIINHAPSVSVIQNTSLREVPYQAFDDFHIRNSEKEGQINLPLTPDFSICAFCKEEISNANNRRFKYAFTTCVQCGPRYAITNKFPFERANTSLASFEMCATCKEEYSNPDSIRFHSQTNSCMACGIRLQLVDKQGNIIETDQSKTTDTAASLISKGYIVAVKNTSGYLLCCSARNKKTITRLRNQKNRPNKPFALLYPNLARIKEDFTPSKREQQTLLSTYSPIVILNFDKNRIPLAIDAIAPNLNQLGVKLPSSALMQLIMNNLYAPMIATSGNIHHSPIISENKDAEQQLGDVADYFVHHNLDIQFPQDDSVIRIAGDIPIILRRSRGLVPNFLSDSYLNNKPILAMGAHLKSTFAFIPNNHIYVSQYFGNLDNYDVYKRLESTIDQYIALFEVLPEEILIDNHPQYQSSLLGQELANKWGARIQKIQHHKAHFCSVLAENNLFKSTETILGVIWDGTGYGDDGAIWGGEFFTYHKQRITRVTHFDYFDWIAGDKMAQEPRLALLSLVSDDNRRKIKHKFSDQEWKVYVKLLQNNTLKTASVGRIFDAVASALEITDYNTYEGEAAMRLEQIALEYKGNKPVNFLENSDGAKIPSMQLMECIFIELEKGTTKQRIAASFIYSLAHIITNIASENAIKIIACSGGVFQNSLLIQYLSTLTTNRAMLLKINRTLSSNDENISLGQLFYNQYIKD